MTDIAGSTTVVVKADIKPLEESFGDVRQQTESLTRETERAFAQPIRAINEASASAQSYAKQLQVITGLQQRINATTGVKDAAAAAGVTASRAADINAYGQALDSLRAKYNPLYAAQQQYRAQLGEINQALKVGALSEQEHAQAIAATKTAFAAQVQAMNATGHAGAVVTGQMMALQHSLRSVTEGLVMGMPPTMILGQQFSHLAYAATGPGGLTGALSATVQQLKGMGSWALALITPLRLAAAGATGFAVAGVAAMMSFESAQRDVTLALSGIGRATGTTRDQINEIADATSSLGGLSVSEARTVASAYAAVGKVATETIAPAVEVTNDLAATLGMSTADAAKMLAKALADPAHGVDELNSRLAGWSDRTRAIIQDLAAQGRILEADRLLIEGVSSSTVKASEVTGFWSRAWHVLGNATSNAMDGLGSGLSNLTGIGLSLEKQLAAAQHNLEAARTGMGSSGIAASNASTRVAALTGEVARLTAELNRNKAASKEVADNLRSLETGAAVRSAVPEIGQRETAARQLDQLRAARASSPGGLSPAVSQGLDQAIARTEAYLANIKSAAQSSVQASNLAAAAISARSPGEIASITRQQTYNQLISQGMSATEAAAAADAAASTARQQAQEKLNEAARNRFNQVRALIAQTQIDTEVVGKNSAQAELLRNNWQAYADLRREAEQNNTAFDNAQYARLVQQNELLAQATMQREGALMQQDMQTPDEKFAQQVANLQALRKADAISFNTYQAGLASAEYQRFQYTQQLLQNERSARESTVNAAVDLLNLFSDKSKAAAIAGIALSKATAIANVILSTTQASAAALAPPPLGLGPIAGAPLAASIEAWGAAQIAVIAATGIAQAASSLSGSGGSSVSASPSVASQSSSSSASSSTSTGSSQTQEPGTTIIIYGDTVSYKQLEDLARRLNQQAKNGGPVTVEQRTGW